MKSKGKNWLRGSNSTINLQRCKSFPFFEPSHLASRTNSDYALDCEKLPSNLTKRGEGVVPLSCVMLGKRPGPNKARTENVFHWLYVDLRTLRP